MNKNKEFDKWLQLEVDDVILYRFDPDDTNKDFIAIITSKTDTKIFFDDVYCLSDQEEELETKVSVRHSDVDVFVFKKFLFNHPSVLTSMKKTHPEYFL